MATVGPGKVVLMHFSLTNATSGEQIDSSEGRDPMPFLFGAHNVLPGIEAAVEGKALGDKLQVNLAAKDAYGVHSGEDPTPYPRSMFPPDAQLFEGVAFQVQDNAGNQGTVWVVRVDGDMIYLDQNHPLAGMDLRFDLEIVGIRDAKDVEIQHGHPHGQHGTDHH